MKMKWSEGFIVTIVALAIVGAYLWRHWEERSHAPVMQVAPDQAGAAEYVHRHESNAPPVTTNSPTPLQNSNKAPGDLGLRERANQMSEAEKIETTNTFVTKLKPAAEKWALVYSNRVPFNLEDLTMDKFVERFGRNSKTFHSYTFVMGDITLSIAEQNGMTQVQYLASKRAVRTMSSMPTTGTSPDLSMPVTRQDVKTLAEADSGQQFPPNLVQLVPSAESGALGGGAIVNVGSKVKNAAGIPISKTSTGFNYVFAKDGTLAFYLRAR